MVACSQNGSSVVVKVAGLWTYFGGETDRFLFWFDCGEGVGWR